MQPAPGAAWQLSGLQVGPWPFTAVLHVLGSMLHSMT